MQRTGIFRMIREKVQESLNAYLQVPAILEGIAGFIVPPHGRSSRGFGRNTVGQGRRQESLIDREYVAGA